MIFIEDVVYNGKRGKDEKISIQKICRRISKLISKNEMIGTKAVLRDEKILKLDPNFNLIRDTESGVANRDYISKKYVLNENPD